MKFDATTQTVRYRWQASEPDFAMPVQAGDPKHWTLLHPTADWQTMPGSRGNFQVQTDLYYVQVVRDGIPDALFVPSAAPVPQPMAPAV